MKKIILLACVFLLSLCVNAYAGENINCVAGYYEGWKVWYDKNSSFVGTSTFHFENQTGVSAFKVKAIVNFYDYFDHYLGRDEANSKGPIHKFLVFKGAVPKTTSKMTCEIYWTDNYEGEQTSDTTTE